MPEDGNKPKQKKLRLSFAASSMERVLACPGSAVMEAAQPRRETFYTDEGHAAHTLAQWALTDGGFDARAYLGREIREKHKDPKQPDAVFTVDEKMCAHVQEYVDSVKQRLDAFRRDKKVKDVKLYVEQKLDTSKTLGVEKQFGIADALIVVEYRDGSGLISVEDFKYGKGFPVVAKDNAQLMTYGAAALEQFGKGLDVKTVSLVIHMPRLTHRSEENMTADDIRAFAAQEKAGVALAQKQEKLYRIGGAEAVALTPGDRQCRFCRAKSVCPAFAKAAAAKKAGEKPSNDPPVKKTPGNPRW